MTAVLLLSNLYLAEGDQVGVRVAPHTGYQGAGFGFLSSKGYQLSRHSCIFGEGSLLYTWAFLNAPVYVVSAVVLVQLGMVVPTVWVSNGGVGMH